MAPMEKNLALPTGAVTRRYIDYCEARAAGGAALILLESMYVHPAGKNHRYQLGIHDDDLVPGYRRLIEACHRHGALVGAQLRVRAGARPPRRSPAPSRWPRRRAVHGADRWRRAARAGGRGDPRPRGGLRGGRPAGRRRGVRRRRDPRSARLSGGTVPLALRQPPRRRVRRRLRAAPALSPRGDRGRARGGGRRAVLSCTGSAPTSTWRVASRSPMPAGSRPASRRPASI